MRGTALAGPQLVIHQPLSHGSPRPVAGAHGEERAGASTSRKNSRPLILAVDDEPDALKILEWFLSREGFQMILASSGAEALRGIEHRLPDLIITDYKMPDMTGLALCQSLRQRQTTRRIPIILHTATQTPALPTYSRLYDLVVTKPSDFPALVSEVRRLLTQSH